MLNVIMLALALTGHAAEHPAAQPGPYVFVPFNSSQKNMNTHGVLLDQRTGRSWVLIATSDGANEGAWHFVARPIQFETGKVFEEYLLEGKPVLAPNNYVPLPLAKTK